MRLTAEELHEFYAYLKMNLESILMNCGFMLKLRSNLKKSLIKIVFSLKLILCKKYLQPVESCFSNFPIKNPDQIARVFHICIKMGD